MTKSKQISIKKYLVSDTQIEAIKAEIAKYEAKVKENKELNDQKVQQQLALNLEWVDTKPEVFTTYHDIEGWTADQLVDFIQQHKSSFKKIASINVDDDHDYDRARSIVIVLETIETEEARQERISAKKEKATQRAIERVRYNAKYDQNHLNQAQKTLGFLLERKALQDSAWNDRNNDKEYEEYLALLQKVVYSNWEVDPTNAYKPENKPEYTKNSDYLRYRKLNAKYKNLGFFERV